MTTTITTSAARAHFSNLLTNVGVRGDRVVLERHGKSLVAVVPVADLELLERLEDTMDLRAAKKAKRGGRVSLADLKADLGL
ncbi:MAG: type II toxin-antitoxin system Phd/YefM family antitoxin [Candidatus Methylacidiphilales bacterium]